MVDTYREKNVPGKIILILQFFIEKFIGGKYILISRSFYTRKNVQGEKFTGKKNCTGRKNIFQLTDFYN